jgi:SecD/SecF fusion protein
MPDRDEPLELLRDLRDVGMSAPDAQELHARVSSAIAEEIEREHNLRRGGLNGSSPRRSRAERLRGVRRRLGFARRAGALVPVVGVLAVALVVALFFSLRGSGPNRTAPTHGSATPRHGAVELVYLAEPSAQAPVVTRGALQGTVQVIRERLRALGIGAARVSVSKANEIMVVLPNARNTARAEREVGTTAELLFFDWEANALTPNGKTVASQLLVQDPIAMHISQGSGSGPAGSPGAVSMPLYRAVQLASKQPYRASPANSRIGSQYWLFGAPGSAACAAAARDHATAPFAGQHCLLAGPDANVNDLKAGLPEGVSASEGQILTVPRGTVVLQALPASFANPVPIGDPGAQFYVLKDNVALRGSDITNPQQTTDPNAGTPVITFGFSSKGNTEFQNLTAQIARRGGQVSGLGRTLNQHFAVALDNQLITVPFIDYKQYPDGINGDHGADISGSFTITAARDLANELRLGALPLNLKLICEGTPATTPCHGPRVR